MSVVCSMEKLASILTPEHRAVFTTCLIAYLTIIKNMSSCGV
jgi:hypothetical protein